MRALHRTRAGELPSTPVRAGLVALTRRAASTIRRCRGLQAKQYSQLSNYLKCKTHILRPGRGTDVDPCDETSLAILLSAPVRRVIVDSHSARVLSFRRWAAPTPASYRLTSPYLILRAAALGTYQDAVMPCQQSLQHHRTEWWTCAICRSWISARTASRSPSARSACQASPVNDRGDKLQSYVADVGSGLPGMGWAINVWHDEKSGFGPANGASSATASSSAKRSVWHSGSRALWLRLDRYATRQEIPQQFGQPLLDLPSSAASQLVGVTAIARRARPARRSNQMTGHLQRCSQRSIPSIPALRSSGTCLPPSLLGDRACAPCLVQQPFILASRLPSRERGSTTQPLPSLPCI
ncbi:hypothetical protein ACVWW6_008840 [Bradyrhizobium sp. USDA 3311]